jgi:ATP-dependent DNA helicase RecG
MITDRADEAIVEAIIAAGESYYAEFKSGWHYTAEGRKPRDIKEVAEDIARTAVAFANSEGGDLLVGVEDDGEVTGIPWTGDSLRYLVSIPNQRVKAQGELGAVVKTVHLYGQPVIWFRVPEHAGEAVITSGGACVWRRGAKTEPVPPAEVQRRRSHILGDLAFESAPISSAQLSDLDEDLVRRSRALVPRPTAPRHFELLRRLQEMPLERLLRYWNLVETHNGTLILRKAALLLFAREPLRWHPNNRVRIRRIHGDEPGFGSRLRTRERELQGPIASLIPAAIRAMQRDLVTEERVRTLFAATHLVPREALEECIVNAVAHRNYAVEGQAIEVLLYPDRIEVVSPGKLPETITIDDLLQQRGVHRSRNPIIMRVLRDLGWSRDQGEGMRRIFGSMRQVELNVPELEESGDTFIVRLSTRSIYDESTQAWIASYGPFGLEPEDRKYMVQLRESGGSLSVDKLARQLNESFDETKKHLERLERQGLVWHRYKSRTYHMVEATNVPHELALRALIRSDLTLNEKTSISREIFEALTGLQDERSLENLATRWRQAGILAPAGRGSWRLGPSFLEYLSKRERHLPEGTS